MFWMLTGVTAATALAGLLALRLFRRGQPGPRSATLRMAEGMGPTSRPREGRRGRVGRGLRRGRLSRAVRKDLRGGAKKQADREDEGNKEATLAIEIVTFTGVDARTDLGKLFDLGERYPKAEFGVLAGTRTSPQEDYGIFPSWEMVKRLQALNVRSAIHLCGSLARAVMRGSMGMAAMSDGFDRVQVNLHADVWPGQLTVDTLNVERFALAVTCPTVILQHRDAWQRVPIIGHPKIEYLFDKSEGRGMESFDLWPSPQYGFGRLGYAGGLGPANIDRAIAFADDHSEMPLWFDMEGNIRAEGCFDLDAVAAVCAKVWPGAAGQ